MSLDLNIIRGELRRFETQIISALLNRGQYALNREIYEIGESGYFKFPQMSLLEVMHYEDEINKARAGKFLQPEERPFFINLPSVERNFIKNPSIINPKFLEINLTAEALDDYFYFLPKICKSQISDREFGSTAECDLASLNILSKRVHFGTFYVSESKFLSDEKTYRELAKKMTEMQYCKS